MKNKNILRIIFRRVLAIITIASVIALITGIWIIKTYYLRTSLEDLFPDAIKISEALATDPNQIIVTDRTDIIVKAYNSSFHESFNLINPNINFETIPEESGFDLESRPFHHPVITDSMIKEALKPYHSSILTGSVIQDIRSLPPLEGTSIIIGLPIVQCESIIGTVFILHPSVEYSSSFYGFLYSYGILVLAFTAFISAILYFSIKRIVKPLQEMTSIAQDLSKGHFNGYLSQNEFYEIEVLAGSLNTLSTQLRSEKEKTELLEKKRNEYFTNISHELKSPLIAIRGMSEAINDHMITDPIELQRYHTVILSESIRMQQLIEDMLYLSRLKDNQDSISLAEVNINEVMKKVVSKYSIIADDMDITFNTCLTNDPIYIVGTEQLIQQIFSCLIDNALKFTPSGGTISIHMMHSPENVILKVIDSGEGIAAEHLPYIFDRYFKADKARGHKGSGLGLAITKAIVELLHGDIKVISQIEKGTEFIICFPLIS